MSTEPALKPPVTDYYGFTLSLTEEESNARDDDLRKQAKRSENWKKFVDPEKIKKSKGKLKRISRKGIPPALRPAVWFEVSGAAKRCELAGPNYFENILIRNAGVDNKNTQVIDLDLPRTFPGHRFIATLEGMAALRRVLLAFSFHNPDIGYCQSLNYVAALLLLVVRDEERTFWVLTALLEDILYPDCHSQDLKGCHVEQRVLKYLLEKKMPKVARYLDELYCDISILTTEWMLTVFVKCMPSESACRILDSLLGEGSKVLHRVALAVFKVNEQSILQARSMGDVVALLQHFTQHLFAADALLKVAFKKIGSLAMKSIHRSRVIHCQVVEHELSERAKRLNRSGMSTTSEKEQTPNSVCSTSKLDTATTNGDKSRTRQAATHYTSNPMHNKEGRLMKDTSSGSEGLKQSQIKQT